jgi:protein-tyrosine phosphatase
MFTEKKYVIREDHELVIIQDDISETQQFKLFYTFDLPDQSANWTLAGDFAGKKVRMPDPDSNRRLYFKISGQGKDYVIAERKVNVIGSYNMRDLGGYSTYDNRHVKWGLLYRSDDLFTLTPSDIEYLENMGIKNIVDYRNLQERTSRPNKAITGTSCHICAPDGEIAALASADIKSDKKKVDDLIKKAEEGTIAVYKTQSVTTAMVHYVTDSHSQNEYQKLLKLLTDKKNVPLIQHCRGGKDRTGFGSALILGALGVEKEEILFDYTLTRMMNKERNEKRMNDYKQYTNNQTVLTYLSSLMDTKEEFLQAAMHEMENMAGSIQNYIITYLNISPAELKQMQDHYLW